VSEPEESVELTSADERVLELVDRLAAGDPTVAEPSADSARENERREALELLGLLPYALDPRPCSPSLEGRVLAALEATGAPAEASWEPSAGPVRRAPRWALPLAAALAGALLGVAAWQQQALDGQRRTITELRAELREVASRGEGAAALEATVREQRAKIAMMTRPGTEFCLLKPVGSEPMYPTATATLVVAPDRASWYMRADGLGPCPLGRTYKIWFMVGGRTVAGPTFRVEQLGDEIEVAAEDLPAGLEGIKITLEFEPETPVPTGPEILFTDQAMRLL